MKDFSFSIIRTLVPALVTWVVGVVTDNFGPIIDDGARAQLVALTYAVAFGIYYFVVRMLETYVAPKFSWFLGDFRRGQTTPVYADATETKVVAPTSKDADGFGGGA